MGPLGRVLRLATIDVSPLRHRDFRLLFIGQFVGFIGSQITVVAVPYQVYEITRSPLAVGLLGAAELVPVLLLALMGGLLADAADRRKLVILTNLGATLLSAVLVLNAFLPEPSLWLMYVVATVQAGLLALQRPALAAMVPRLVPREDLVAAGALSWLRQTAGGLVGPALAGVLIASLGLPATYGLDLLALLVSLVSLALMRSMPAPLAGERPSLRRIVEGLDYARSRPVLMGTYIVDIVAMIFGMPSALFPAIAENLGGPSVLGLLYAAPALGALLVTVTSGWTARVNRHGLAVILAAIGWGAAIIAFGFTSATIPAVIFLALAGGADAVSGIFRNVVWNETVPDQLRGRLASIEMLSYSTGPLIGNAEAGFVAALAGVPFSVVSGGVLCVLGCALCGYWLPAFRGYDARVARRAREEEAATTATVAA